MKTRAYIIFSVLAAAALILSACGPASTPPPTSIPPTKAPAPLPEPTKPPAPPPPTAAPVAPTLPAGPKAGGTLVFGLASDIPSIEPHLEAASVWHQRKPLIYENLTWVDYDVVAKPMLAESWEVKDNKVFTFKLRQGVKFHNGKELDADDVKYSLERQLDEKLGSAGRGDLLMIDKIEVVDKSTIRITLNEPSGVFLAALGARYNAIIPKDSAPTPDTLRRTAIGTGPFMVEEFVPSQKLVLKKNPDYWDKGKPLLDKLVFQQIPDETSIVAGLRAGTLDAAVLLDAQQFLLLKDDKTLVSMQAPAIQFNTMELPCDVKPLDNPKVRQAISLAIDKPSIVQAAIFGLGQVVGGMPPAMKFWATPLDQLPNQKRDVAQAKQLLTEAGFGNGFDLKLRSISGDATYAAIAPVIAANLKDVGIQVKVETIDIGVWIEDWRARREPATLNDWGGFMDPDLLYYRHFHSQPMGMDFRRCASTQLDQLLEKGRATVDPAQRKQYYDAVQKLLAEEVPMIPLFSADTLYVTQPYVKGFTPHPSGWYYGFKDAWLDK